MFGMTRKKPLTSRPPNNAGNSMRNNSGNALLNGNFSLKNPRFANLRTNKLKQLANQALPQVESLYFKLKEKPYLLTNSIYQQQKTIRNNLKAAYNKLQKSGQGNYTNQISRLSSLNYEGLRGSNASSVSLNSHSGGRRSTRRNRRCFCRR